MKLIKTNPYRILGLLAGASAKEQQKQISKLKMYLDAEQEPEDDFSFSILGSLNRTVDNVGDAASKLNLESDKINAALFWFINGNEITDEPAFDALKDSSVLDALNIWSKLIDVSDVTNKNYSAFLNLSTYKLNIAFSNVPFVTSALQEGITLKLKFLESDLLNEFVKKIVGITYKPKKEELQKYFLTQVQLELEKTVQNAFDKFLDIITQIEFSGKEDFLKEFTQKPIQQIEKKIDDAREQRKANKAAANNIGISLFEETADSLAQLKATLGLSNSKFVSISDKVSEEVLQCGIDYFTYYRETNTDPSSASMSLIRKAKTLAVGNFAKQRCEENTNNLKEWIDEKPNRDIQKKAGDDIEYIISKINLAVHTLNNSGRYPKGYDDPYSKLPFHEQPHNKEVRTKSFDSQEINIFSDFRPGGSLDFFQFKVSPENINLFYISRDIVSQCKPRLDKIKKALGESNNIYQKLSNDIASLSLNCLIKQINNTIDTDPIQRFGSSRPDVDEHSMKALIAIEELYMDFETRKRYNEQKISLFNLYKSVNGKRYSPITTQANSATGNTTSTTTTSTTSSSGSGNCYIATMAYGDYNHPQVIVLRQFRDNVLDKSIMGKWFIRNYYHYSPKLVEKLKNKKNINTIIRNTLNQFIKLIN